MTVATRAGLGLTLALAALVATGMLTRFGYPASADDAAVLRLAWRARVPLVEECRSLTAGEQAELPVHMRRESICEGRVASYHLEVSVDGRLRHESTVSGAGARGDRPLYVFETLPLQPGPLDLRVTLERIGEGGAPAAEPVRTMPDTLRLVRSIVVEGGDVLLVSYDPDRRELLLR